MQRPGTLDYSRWVALDTSSDDEEPRRMPTPTPKPEPPPKQVVTAPPTTPLPPPSLEVCAPTDAGELFLKVLPALLAHPALASATYHIVDELPDLPVVSKLPPALLASLRSVAAADAAPRAAARLACVCTAARAAVATLNLNDAAPPQRKALRAIDRRRVADALVRGLQYYNEDGDLAIAVVLAPDHRPSVGHRAQLAASGRHQRVAARSICQAAAEQRPAPRGRGGQHGGRHAQRAARPN